MDTPEINNNIELKPKLFSTLYWRLSATFLLLLVLLGFAYVFTTASSANKYYQETNQKLNGTIAAHIVQEISPFTNGEVDKKAIQDIMHHMMVINPAVEVYLLDLKGKILSYVAPYKKVKLESVSLEPVKTFIETKGSSFIVGDDPRNPGKTKVFSAAPVLEDGKQKGYIYVILASEEYDSVTSMLIDNYILRVGTQSFIITLIAAFAIGLLIIWLLTRNLQVIIETVKKFEKGDLNARIPVKSDSELSRLGNTFNEMADTILKNIEEIKAVDKLRKELIANVSHDLRTPISIMHGYIETLLMKNGSLSSDERKNYLETVLMGTENLKKLVSELFELSKLEARQTKVKKEPFFINELLQDTYHKYKFLAEEKGITIQPLFSKKLPMVYADIALIERVLQNLIDNAIKYTPSEGSITLGLELESSAIEVSISNTGDGIPEEEIPLIFDRYYKVKNQPNKKTGTGLGLAIVKNILEIHQSSIKASSRFGDQTTFAFDLPVYQN